MCRCDQPRGERRVVEVAGLRMQRPLPVVALVEEKAQRSTRNNLPSGNANQKPPKKLTFIEPVERALAGNVHGD